MYIEKTLSTLEIETTRLKYFYYIGADGRSRTGTAKGHYPLKVACLPVSPRRQYNISLFIKN